jgi:uncharacterized protein (TIGR02646 family)
MRQISGGHEPQALVRWRVAAKNDPNFGYGLLSAELRNTLRAALIDEQRWLCAYTGVAINMNNCHIEHLIPQAHCPHGEDVAYTNMVACFPAPNAPYIAFGALRKGDWPSADQQHRFVSPRSPDCEKRFVFNLRGEIAPADHRDVAAADTINRLGLDDRGLTARRKAAVDGTLQLLGRGPASLDLKSARRRRAQLQRAENIDVKLEPFCFALKQALELHIRRLEAIRASIQRNVGRR